MNLSDLQQMAAVLERSLHRWESLLFIATLFVVVGLILEYFHHVKGLVKERPIKRKSLLEIVGAIFVVLGVSGELWVQHKASAVETNLQLVSHRVEGLLNQKAGEADREAQQATSDYTGAELKIADANAAAAGAKALAESERLERVRLEAIVSPRSLSLEQQQLIAAACARFRGHAVMLLSYGLDGEGAALGAQIISTLKSVGVVVADNRASMIVTGGFEDGVHVRGPATEQAFVSTLGNALSSFGKLQVSLNDTPSDSGALITNRNSRGGFVSGGVESFPAGKLFVTVMIGIKPVPILPVK